MIDRIIVEAIHELTIRKENRDARLAKHEISERRTSRRAARRPTARDDSKRTNAV